MVKGTLVSGIRSETPLQTTCNKCNSPQTITELPRPIQKLSQTIKELTGTITGLSLTIKELIRTIAEQTLTRKE